MLLNDIGSAPDATFRKINQILETNYGFKIAGDVSDKDLISIIEQIEEEITGLKMKGQDAKSSAEISKRLLVLEGLENLREYSLMSFQSPMLIPVVTDLTKYVVTQFRRSGLSQSDFDDALNHAMSIYRSSEFRFPDDMIAEKVRSAALVQISKEQSNSGRLKENTIDEIDTEATGDAAMAGSDLSEDDYNSVGNRASAFGGHSSVVPATPHAQRIMRVLHNPILSLDGGDNQVPIIRDRDGRMIAAPATDDTDPYNKVGANFTKPAPHRVKEGNQMKEHKNLVKNLRRLLETEVSQAEVMMAAKGFAQELQEMIEKIGRLQNEDLPPVTDQMRETYGMESASAFQTQIYGALQSVMDSLYTAKGQVDDAVSNMAATGQFTAPTDMDKDADMGTAMDSDELDLDNIGDELAADSSDEFGGAESDDPLGRSIKSESARLEQQVLEMHRLVSKARKLRESRIRG